MLTVNTLAPYLLTGLIQRPDRLIYLTSDMHTSGDDSLHDLTWSSRRWNGTQAYCDSKLFVTALALAVARRWPDVISHAVDPGWVPTRMGGPGASDDLEQGHLTQTWLATTDDPEALRSGQVWKHRRPTAVAAAAQDATFQDRLLDQLADLTSHQFLEAATEIVIDSAVPYDVGSSGQACSRTRTAPRRRPRQSATIDPEHSPSNHTPLKLAAADYLLTA